VGERDSSFPGLTQEGVLLGVLCHSLSLFSDLQSGRWSERTYQVHRMFQEQKNGKKKYGFSQVFLKFFFLQNFVLKVSA
jgi:hypothetical protein